MAVGRGPTLQGELESHLYPWALVGPRSESLPPEQQPEAEKPTLEPGLKELPRRLIRISQAKRESPVFSDLCAVARHGIGTGARSRQNIAAQARPLLLSHRPKIP